MKVLEGDANKHGCCSDPTHNCRGKSCMAWVSEKRFVSVPKVAETASGEPRFRITDTKETAATGYGWCSIAYPPAPGTIP